MLEGDGARSLADPVLPARLPPGAIGLQLRTSEITRITQLLLHEGIYRGLRLVPGDYIVRMTADTTDTGRAEPDNRTYGLHVWLCARDGAWRMDGIYGQFGIVVPGHHACVSIMRARAGMSAWAPDGKHVSISPSGRRAGGPPVTPCRGLKDSCGGMPGSSHHHGHFTPSPSGGVLAHDDRGPRGEGLMRSTGRGSGRGSEPVEKRVVQNAKRRMGPAAWSSRRSGFPCPGVPRTAPARPADHMRTSPPGSCRGNPRQTGGNTTP
jgi:hypothetical protein